MSASTEHVSNPIPSFRGGRQHIAQEWPWIVGAALYLLIVYLLPPPAALEAGLDQSFQSMLTEMFLRGAQFGRDVVYPLGPWGFLLRPRGNPDIFSWALFGRSVIALGTAVGAGSLSVRYIASPVLRAVWLLAFLILAEPIFLAPFLLFATVIAPDEGKADWRHLFLIPACGLAASVKFTVLMLLGTLVGVLVFDCIAWRRRSVLIPIGLILSFLVFHYGAGQRGGMTDYLIGNLSIAGSYAAVFSTRGPLAELGIGVLVCVVVLACWTFAAWRAQRWRGLVLSLWAAFYLFVSFKQAFVRSDPFHLFVGVFDMLLPASLILLMLVPAFLQNRSGVSLAKSPWVSPWIWAPASALLIATLYFIPRLPETYRVTGLLLRLERLPLTFSSTLRAETYRQEVAKIQSEHPIGHLKGTVALFGNELYLLSAWNFDIHQFPLLQPSEAQNQYLTKKDVEFLTAKSAPEHVLFNVEMIDKHLPAIDDSLAWRAMLSNYEPVEFRKEYLHLRRSDHPVSIGQDKLLERTLAFGEVLQLPDVAPLWASVDVRFNSIGRLAGSLLKLPAIKLLIDNGTVVRDYRLMPGTAAAGFLLSPVIERPADFTLLYRGEIQAEQKARRISVTVLPPSATRLLAPQVNVRIYHLLVPARPKD